jgi:hypothetical protein
MPQEKEKVIDHQKKNDELHLKFHFFFIAKDNINE